MSGTLGYPHHHHQVTEVDDDVLDHRVHLPLLLPPVSERLEVFRVILSHERLGLVGLTGCQEEN